MKRIIAATLGLWLGLTGPLMAQSNSLLVVELFTSQGCSSCPPADAIMARLADDPSLLAISLHVDYWDYLGWKDDFGSPAFTARQKEYAHHNRDKMVYTPQMVVQGGTRVVGSRTSEVESAIRKARAQKAPVSLALERQGGKVLIRAEGRQGLPKNMRVQLVRYQPSESVAIRRGENAGKTITYRNIVTSWKDVARWNGTSPLELSVGIGGSDAVAVIVQADGPAEVLGAARLP